MSCRALAMRFGNEQGWPGNSEDLQTHLGDHFIQGLMDREGQGKFREPTACPQGMRLYYFHVFCAMACKEMMWADPDQECRQRFIQQA
jgi:hypothetical protein